MRLIGKSTNRSLAERFSAFLQAKGIENRLETHLDSNEEPFSYTVWIINEDDTTPAKEYWEQFQKNPEDATFRHPSPVLPAAQPEDAEKKKPTLTLSSLANKENWQKGRDSLAELPARFQKKGRSPLTILILLVCSFLFLITVEQRPVLSQKDAALEIQNPALVLSKVEKKLFYDYPLKFQLADKLVYLLGVDKFLHPENLNEADSKLYQTYLHTPYWEGLTQELLTPSKERAAQSKAPLFEQIRKGELWRLFTPALLHANFLHIFFNMLWVVVLSFQIESRLKFWRMLLFILFVGIFSNTAQYLMDGFLFSGFSGVVVGMAVFIWVRQRKAPWEGYFLQKATFAFLAVYVLGLVLLGMISLALSITGVVDLNIPIANSAHLAGGIAGYLFGISPLARWKA